MTPLRAPFPWFGGKSRAAPIVWRAFGDVANYVEPFFGSGAVLLGRPHAPRTETANDRDAYLANFWRAVQRDPGAVAAHADAPIHEADLHARHRWLLAQDGFREAMLTDPDFCDAKVAGWWVWGQCLWIGDGWCAPRRRGEGRPSQQLPHLADAGMGIHRKLPHLGNAGRGPALSAYLGALAERLRGVRVACGDWSRVLGDSVTFRHGTTGVLLDPPYDDGAVAYSAGGTGVSTDVRAWAVANGGNPDLRIALCGYEGEHVLPDDWRVVEWKARGGYGATRADGTNENAARERVWLSPHCLRDAPARQPSLFSDPVPR